MRTEPWELLRVPSEGGEVERISRVPQPWLNIIDGTHYYVSGTSGTDATGGRPRTSRARVLRFP